ncbi:MAG: hypothetical protein WD830_00705 [Chloroflexota bacterium]
MTAACQSLAPLPHDELESIMFEAITAADSYDGVEINAFGPGADSARAELTLGQPAPEYEAAMRERFGDRIAFSYGPGGIPIICMFPKSEETPDFCP